MDGTPCMVQHPGLSSDPPVRAFSPLITSLRGVLIRLGTAQTHRLLAGELRPGARVRRIGRFLGRTLRWTTEVTSVLANTLDLQIIDGPMRGTVMHRIDTEGTGSRPRFAMLVVHRGSLHDGC